MKQYRVTIKLIGGFRMLGGKKKQEISLRSTLQIPGLISYLAHFS